MHGARPLPLPLEVLWLFHHVLKTALYQLKAFELVPAQTAAGEPSATLKGGVSAALAASTAFGVWALAFAADDHVRCSTSSAPSSRRCGSSSGSLARSSCRATPTGSRGWCAAQFGAWSARNSAFG